MGGAAATIMSAVYILVYSGPKSPQDRTTERIISKSLDTKLAVMKSALHRHRY